MENQSIVFAYWVKGELKGFRADTFGTISKTHPKIYTYSKEQVEMVLDNIKSSCNKAGTSFLKSLINKSDNIVIVNDEGNMSSDLIGITDHVSQNEDEIRSWGRFEVRVHPFVGRDEMGGYPDKWRIEAEINNLKPEIESHKFLVLHHEN